MIENRKPIEIAASLDGAGIAVRAGDLASLPALKRFGVTAAVRASCYIYTSTEDIDRLVAGLQQQGSSSARSGTSMQIGSNPDMKTALFVEVRARARAKKLCHNCDAKPVLAAKTDFIDDALLLILWNLLKTQEGPKIPAYRLARQILSLFDSTRIPAHCF